MHYNPFEGEDLNYWFKYAWFEVYQILEKAKNIKTNEVNKNWQQKQGPGNGDESRVSQRKQVKVTKQ